ncbi:MAG: HAD family hydrolase [bacterium]
MAFKALLFDLDGTLLDLDMETFLPAYFQALTRRFGQLVDPQQFVDHLVASTAVMMASKDPEKTNEEVFMADFIPRLGLSREVLLPLLDDFYRNDFPALAGEARRKPLAREIIQYAFARGFAVVIATNPVFPKMAISHRLRWAGVEDFPYKLITTYEIMHFCKPHREYYAEILDRLGLKAEECLMIGNDAQEDLSAREVGIKTFLLQDHLINRTEECPQTDYRGYMEDLYEFIKGL